MAWIGLLSATVAAMLACGPPPEGDTTAAAVRVAGQGTSRVGCPGANLLYLNFDGAMMRGDPSCEDAAESCSGIIGRHLGTVAVSYPAFSGSAGLRQTIAAEVASYFRPFRVRIVTERPQAGPYSMIMIGGSPADIGVGEQAGIAPLDCGNRVASDIAYVFTEQTGPDPHRIATSVAQETGHLLGLGHVDDPSDIMHPFFTLARDAFHDYPMKISIENGTAATDCSGTGQQNDVTLLLAELGPPCEEPK